MSTHTKVIVIDKFGKQVIDKNVYVDDATESFISTANFTEFVEAIRGAEKGRPDADGQIAIDQQRKVVVMSGRVFWDPPEVTTKMQSYVNKGWRFINGGRMN